MRRATALVIMILFAAGPSLAVTIHVPGDQPTIAAGLAVAEAGDIVLVAPGAYVEHDLVMPSDVTLRGATGVADDVLIDARSLGRVMLVSGCGPSTNIEYLTFTNGWVELGSPNGYEGGGISCRSAQPQITRCLFRANHAEKGGGLHCRASNPTIIECRFEENSAYSGGGVYLYSSGPEFLTCTFSENSVETDGGAMFISASAPLLENCVLAYNRARIWGGGVFAQSPGTRPVRRPCAGMGGIATARACPPASTSTACKPAVRLRRVGFSSRIDGSWPGCCQRDDPHRGRPPART